MKSRAYKFCQIRRKTPVPESFLNNVADLSLQLHLKRESVTGFPLRILRNFEEQLFYRTPPGGCFCIAPVLSLPLCVVLTEFL